MYCRLKWWPITCLGKMMTTSTMTCNFSDRDVSGFFLVTLRSGHSRSYNRWWLWCPMPKTDRKFVHFFFLLLFTKLQKYFSLQKWNAFLNHCRSPKHKMQCCHFSMPTSKSHFLHLLKFIRSKKCLKQCEIDVHLGTFDSDIKGARMFFF